MDCILLNLLVVLCNNAQTVQKKLDEMQQPWNMLFQASGVLSSKGITEVLGSGVKEW
jgi:hypothetical protein